MSAINFVAATNMWQLSVTEVVSVALDRGPGCAADAAQIKCSEKWKGPSR